MGANGEVKAAPTNNKKAPSVDILASASASQQTSTASAAHIKDARLHAKSQCYSPHSYDGIPASYGTACEEDSSQCSSDLFPIITPDGSIALVLEAELGSAISLTPAAWRNNPTSSSSPAKHGTTDSSKSFHGSCSKKHSNDIFKGDSSIASPAHAAAGENAASSANESVKDDLSTKAVDTTLPLLTPASSADLAGAFKQSRDLTSVQGAVQSQDASSPAEGTINRAAGGDSPTAANAATRRQSLQTDKAPGEVSFANGAPLGEKAVNSDINLTSEKASAEFLVKSRPSPASSPASLGQTINKAALSDHGCSNSTAFQASDAQAPLAANDGPTLPAVHTRNAAIHSQAAGEAVAQGRVEAVSQSASASANLTPKTGSANRPPISPSACPADPVANGSRAQVISDKTFAPSSNPTPAAANRTYSFSSIKAALWGQPIVAVTAEQCQETLDETSREHQFAAHQALQTCIQQLKQMSHDLVHPDVQSSMPEISNLASCSSADGNSSAHLVQEVDSLVESVLTAGDSWLPVSIASQVTLSLVRTLLCICTAP